MITIITPGHEYELIDFESYNNPSSPVTLQNLRFVNKRPNSANNELLELVHDGTTNEDLLKVLINRTQYLQSKFPCRENAIALTKMDEALMWFEKRTADRIARNVEGKHIK